MCEINKEKEAEIVFDRLMLDVEESAGFSHALSLLLDNQTARRISDSVYYLDSEHTRGRWGNRNEFINFYVNEYDIREYAESHGERTYSTEVQDDSE